MTSRNIAIVGSAGSWHSQSLTLSLSEHDITPVFVDPLTLKVELGTSTHVLSGDVVLSDFDLVLVRDIPGGSLEQVIFRMDVLHQLENTGVRVINSPYSIEKMVDKYYTSSLLKKTGLHVPETRVFENISEGIRSFHELGNDVVVKPLFGNRGIGMVRVTEEDIAGRTFRALQLGGYIYYLQRFIPHNNRDIRVMVVGDECIAAMERVADQWKTNIASGGTPTKFELTDEIIFTSLKAAKAVGADYCGVDLLRSENGELYVIEVNSMPAWQGLQQVTKCDIATLVIDYCLKQTL